MNAKGTRFAALLLRSGFVAVVPTDRVSVTVDLDLQIN